ncbi:MAG: winged helix-turn-helix transcriptional regulator, partial [Candidatus Micrarchaeota archaeon]|nr:winged helix-turn-helix transcriptional regulator [Candidatus Micrarchaeota archaeon]
MTAVKLDVKDRRILAALDSNSRQPLSAIAKRTGLSEQVVSYRISRLVERGVITGFVAFISPAKLGYMTFKLFIKLGNIRPGVESELIGYLVRSRSTMWVFSCTGRYDLVVLVSARDPEHFRSFWNNFQSKYGKYVTGVDTAVNIYVYEYMRKYLGAGGEILANTSYLGGPIRREDIDELDLRILKEVSCDSRASNMAIGKKVGASAEVVRYRIKELVAKGVIPAFRIWVNTERLGMQF